MRQLCVVSVLAPFLSFLLRFRLFCNVEMYVVKVGFLHAMVMQRGLGTPPHRHNIKHNKARRLAKPNEIDTTQPIVA